MKRNTNMIPIVALAAFTLGIPAWADPLPISNPGGPYAVISTGADLTLTGSGTPSDTGTTITNYEWDLDGDDDFDDATGPTPAAISYADLTTTWGMTSGPNTIKLQVTDDSPTPLKAIAEATVYIDGTIYIGTSGSGGTDKWNVPGNWNNGVPSGAVDAIIPDKTSAFTVAVTSSSVPTYTGDLTIGNNVILQIGWVNGSQFAACYNAVGTPGSTTISMGNNSRIKNRNPRGGANWTVPAVVLNGNATFQNKESTELQTNPSFNYPVTGSHTLTMEQPGTCTFKAANSFAALVATSGATVVTSTAGTLGSGNVTINDTSKLTVGVEGSIADSATLTISGSTSNQLTMNANETVDKFFLGALQLPAGDYTSASGAWITGASTLTVTTGSTETTPPTVASWVNNVGGGPIYEDQVEVTYTVTFDEDISTTLTTSEFAVVGTGGASGTVASVTKTSTFPNPAVYTVVVQPSGTGKIQLQIPGSVTIKDLNGNALVVPVSDLTEIEINSGSTPITPGNRYWDGTLTSGTTNGASNGGTANWDNGTTTNWDRGPGLNSPVAWNNASGDTAIFGGTAGTVTLDEDITLDGLTFQVVDAVASGYFIGDVAEDNTLTFSGSKTITLNATGTNNNQDATIRAGIAGAPTLNIHGRANNNQFFALEPTANVTMTLGTLNMFNTFASNKQLRLGGPSTGNVVDQVTWTVTANQLQVRKQDSTNGGADGSSWTINQNISLDDGRIYVDEGTLIFGGTDNFITHSIEIGDGGRIVLQGNWRIHDENEDFRVLSGGIVAPGGSVGTATFNWNSSRGDPSVGLVDFRTGSTYEWEVGSANTTDVIALTEPVVGGNAELVVASGTTLKVLDAGVTTPIASTDQLTVFTYQTGVTRSIGTVTIDTSALGAGWGGTPTLTDDNAGTIFITGLTFTPPSSSPFETWAGAGVAFDADANNDGVDNGLAWVLGATDKDANAIALLPTLDNTTDPDFFIFTYRRDDDANTDPKTNIKVEYGSTLSVWTPAVAGPDIIITPTDDGAGVGVDLVQVKIRRTLAVGGKLFARLNVLNTP